MPIIYSDERHDGPPSVPYHRWNANKGWLKHYENSLTLTFIVHATKDRVEKAQAQKELDIADRKMKFWENHPNFEKAVVIRGAEELKRKWK